MPEMDGYTTISHLMNLIPTPVVIVTNFDREEVNSRLMELNLPVNALRAIKYVKKENSNKFNDNKRFKNELIKKIVSLSEVKLPQPEMISDFGSFMRDFDSDEIIQTEKPRRLLGGFQQKLILIGASAGSTQAISWILSKLTSNYSPILIVEHMPEEATKPYVMWLQSMYTNITIKIATDGIQLEPNGIYIVPGGKQCIVRSNKSLHVFIDENESNYTPSINTTFISAKIYGSQMVGIVLSGLAATDTLEGVKTIKTAGGTIIAEHMSTSVFYAMPKAIINAGLADEVVPMYDIPFVLQNLGYI